MTDTPEPQTPTPVDRRIANAVAELIEATGDSKMALAVALDIGLTSLYRKLHGGTWKPDEIEFMCRRYGVQPNDLFSGNPIVLSLALEKRRRKEDADGVTTRVSTPVTRQFHRATGGNGGHSRVA